MKKYFSLLFLSMFALILVNCSDDDNDNYVDTDTIAQVIDIRENFVNDSGANQDYLYGILKTFTQPLYNTDVVLIYRQDTSSGTAVWKILPKTYYFSGGGALDYHFDFTVNDVQIYADANFNMTAESTAFKNQYLNNQVFRVVLVPASGKNTNVKYEDYESVIKHYNIDDSNVPVL
ncbi:MAG: hypothetical protein QM564_05745 [Bergeyella sp.]